MTVRFPLYGTCGLKGDPIWTCVEVADGHSDSNLHQVIPDHVIPNGAFVPIRDMEPIPASCVVCKCCASLDRNFYTEFEVPFWLLKLIFIKHSHFSWIIQQKVQRWARTLYHFTACIPGVEEEQNV